MPTYAFLSAKVSVAEVAEVVGRVNPPLMRWRVNFWQSQKLKKPSSEKS